MKYLNLVIIFAILILSQLSFAAGKKTTATKPVAPVHVKKTPVYESRPPAGSWATRYGPWDFSGLIAFNTPGVGGEALAAYRIVDHLVEDFDDTLSIESGLGYISASDSYYNVSYTYSYLEIPIMARWDIHIRDSKFTVGPRAGFYYLTGGTATVNTPLGSTSVTTRGGSLYVQIGGSAFFHIDDQWAIRADLGVGGFTNISFGATYFL